MQFRVFVVAVLLAAALQVCAGPPWTPAAFPNPKIDLDKCGRKGLPSNICDPDGILSQQGADRIEGILKEIYEGVDPYVRAPCGSKGLEGYQVAVALMRSMVVPPGDSPAAEAAIFARALHDAWGVGDAACNNGVLLFLSQEDRQVYISTGQGALAALSDSQVQSIIAAMRPLLRKQAYDEALEQAVVDIGLGLAGRGAEEEGAVDWFAVGFFGIVALLIGNSCRRSWLRRREYRDCKRMLAKLKREQDQLQHHAWSAPSSCPICLEDFNPPPTPRRNGNAAAGAGTEGCGGEGQPCGSGLHGGASPEDSPSTSLLMGGSGSELQGAEGSSEAESISRAGAGLERGGMRRRSVGKALNGEGQGAGGTRPRRIAITLKCGHTFCDPCLTKWLEQKTTCPVCRDKVTDSGSSPREHHHAGSAAAAAEAGSAVQANRVLPDLWAMELAFRLGSLQRMYPGYLSPSMADQWVAEARETGTFNWEQSREFQLRDPGMRAQHESHGGGGFSASFGGGSSFGGGGGGGSW